MYLKMDQRCIHCNMHLKDWNRFLCVGCHKKHIKKNVRKCHGCDNIIKIIRQTKQKNRVFCTIDCYNKAMQDLYVKYMYWVYDYVYRSNERRKVHYRKSTSS